MMSSAVQASHFLACGETVIEVCCSESPDSADAVFRRMCKGLKTAFGAFVTSGSFVPIASFLPENAAP
jgi:hypothetical protein